MARAVEFPVPACDTFRRRRARQGLNSRLLLALSGQPGVSNLCPRAHQSDAKRLKAGAFPNAGLSRYDALS